MFRKNIKTFWLSFADPVQNKFLGVVIADGINLRDAHFNAILMGLNPGGEVLAVDITESAHKVKSEYKWKLLNQDKVDDVVLENYQSTRSYVRRR